MIQLSKIIKTVFLGQIFRELLQSETRSLFWDTCMSKGTALHTLSQSCQMNPNCMVSYGHLKQYPGLTQATKS